MINIKNLNNIKKNGGKKEIKEKINIKNFIKYYESNSEVCEVFFNKEASLNKALMQLVSEENAGKKLHEIVKNPVESYKDYTKIEVIEYFCNRLQYVFKCLKKMNYSAKAENHGFIDINMNECNSIKDAYEIIATFQIYRLEYGIKLM